MRFRFVTFARSALSGRKWSATRQICMWGLVIGLANVVLSWMGDDEVSLRFPFPIGWVVPYCLLTALASGLIVDLLRPFARSRVAGAWVGFVASVPLSLGYMIVAGRDVLARPRSAIIVMTLFGLTYGVLIGAMYWKPPSNSLKAL